MNKKKVSEYSSYFKYLVSKMHLKKAFLRYGLSYIKGTVLDVGSGKSPLSRLAPDSRVVTIDYDAKRAPMSIGSCVALPFKDQAFDSIICTEVLEHVAEPEVALSEMLRVMKPGGHIYISAPMTWSLHYEPYDFYRYTNYGLTHLMEKAGFKIISLEAVGGLFSFLFSRFGEFNYYLFNKIFFFLPRGVRIYFIVPFVWPIARLLYVFSLLLDPLSPTDVFAWSVVAERKE